MKGYKIEPFELKSRSGRTMEVTKDLDEGMLTLFERGKRVAIELTRKDMADLMDWLAMAYGHTDGLYDKDGNIVVEPRQYMDFGPEPVLSCCGDEMTGLDVPICPTCKEWQ